jgi:hypothetical protein
LIRILIAIAWLSLATKATGNEAFKTILHKTDGGAAKLSLYGAGCGDENMDECFVADLGCDIARGSFAARVTGYASKEVAAWLVASSGASTLKIDNRKFNLHGNKIEFSDMNSTWDIMFGYENNAAEIWTALRSSKVISIIAGGRVQSFAASKATYDLANLCASEKIYYGSRVGMTVTVVSKQDLDTAHAVIVTEHTNDDAIDFCREYIGKVTTECVNEEAAVKLNQRISSNCKTANRSEVNPKYVLRNLITGEIADGSSASGYSTRMGIFRALCPKTAPSDE